MATPRARALYRFSFSHYAEKARWALDWKQLRVELREVGMGPGQVLLKLRTGSRQVPVLVDEDGTIVADSTRILDYLDARYEDHPLWPTDPAERTRARELEAWADERIGKGIRAYLFATSGSDPRVPRVFKLGAPLNPLLVRAMGPDYCGYASLAEAERAFPEVVGQVGARLGSGSYLVGNRFTAADLTVCALLNPIYSPRPSPLRYPWSSSRPPMASDPAIGRVFDWMDHVYGEHRHAVARG